MSFVFVYITVPSPEEAVTIGRSLVEERLAACANILDGMRTFYWWEGAVQEGSETVLIAKTRRDLVARLSERVKALHSYDCPCVAALPLEDGNPAYLDWIAAETRKAAATA